MFFQLSSFVKMNMNAIFTQHLSPLEPEHYCMMVYLHFREKVDCKFTLLQLQISRVKRISVHIVPVSKSLQFGESAFSNDVVVSNTWRFCGY